ncbi:baseplate assembly protein [Acetobacter sacchari]|nr:baseplate assembly protein [Acetobacter sacchari]
MTRSLHAVISRMVAQAVANSIPAPSYGLVTAVDPINHAVKVALQPDGVESGWVQYGVGVRSGDLRMSAPPSIGQHVKVTPVGGDAEHLVVSADVFDDIIQSPTSPQTGKVAQSGEMLVMAGCGAPPTDTDTRTAGDATEGAGWFHITADGFYAGAAGATLSITTSSIVAKVGGCTMTLTSSGLSVTGGDITATGTVTGQTDVKTSSHSLNSHVHTNGNNGANTGGPVG